MPWWDSVTIQKLYNLLAIFNYIIQCSKSQTWILDTAMVIITFMFLSLLKNIKPRPHLSQFRKWTFHPNYKQCVCLKHPFCVFKKVHRRISNWRNNRLTGDTGCGVLERAWPGFISRLTFLRVRPDSRVPRIHTWNIYIFHSPLTPSGFRSFTEKGGTDLGSETWRRTAASDYLTDHISCCCFFLFLWSCSNIFT